MARPKKEKELKRSHRIMLRFTDVEYEIISENAKRAKMPLAEFARLQAMNKKVKIKYELVASVPELKKLITEFGRIASNINQIARQFNQGGPISPELQKKAMQCFSDMFEMKYEVLKMAGDFASDQEAFDRHIHKR